MEIAEKIIEKIKKNRISSTEIADCLEKTGAINGLMPLNRGKFCVGKVFWVYARDESNWEVHEQIRDVREGDIVFIEPFNCNGRAIFGELVSKYLLLYRQVNGIVVKGKMRDLPHLIKENWPIWFEGANPVGCFNRKPVSSPNLELITQHHNLYHNSIAVCDDTGVVIIEKQHHTDEFIKKLEWVEEQEDIWFDCIDRKKWSTFDTVCLKKYLSE